MYGGYGSNYGGLGGYGGMSYGGGYGSSIGSYSSYNRPGTFGQIENNQDPNSPQQEPNQSTFLFDLGKIVVEEFFKMMGGLRSMVEIGFSFVAIGNFGSKSFKLLKKIIAFLSQTSHNFVDKISGSSGITDKMNLVFGKTMMISPESKNGNTVLNKILFIFRLLAALVLIVGVVLKRKLKDEIEKEHEEIAEKFTEVKLEEERLEIIERMETIEAEEYHHQREAYF